MQFIVFLDEADILDKIFDRFSAAVILHTFIHLTTIYQGEHHALLLFIYNYELI